MRHRGLYRPLGKPAQLCEDRMAHGDRFPSRSLRAAIKLQIYKKRRAGPAVRYQVAHQDVHNV